MALLLAVLWVITQKMGANVRSFSRPQVALSALSPQQLRDQGDVRHALQALGHALPQMPAQAVAADPSERLQQPLLWPQEGIFAMLAPEAAAPAPAPVAAASARLAPAPFARATQEKAPLPVSLPAVSVVLASGVAGKAVVNGHLVQVGDTVGEGLVVQSIALDKVTFATGTQQVQVHLPLERLRVLGAFPQPTTSP